MSTPSEPLLAWLRSVLDDKQMNTASLANQLSLPRRRVR